MKRKLMAAALSLAMVASLVTGCSSDQKEAAAPTAAPAAGSEVTASGGDAHKIYLITMDQMDQHWVNVDAGAQKAVAELGGIDYKWLAPDVKDDAKQIECINNAVAGGAEAILLAANGPDAVTAALQEAIDGGVKVVYVDSAASLPAVQTLATDNEAAGKTAGEEMIKALKANGIEDGKIGIVNVNAATASTVAREKGFRSAFDGSKFELLETQYGEGDAAKSKDIAANYITQGCVGIFGANEGSTVGTGNAIQEAGETVIGVGFDKSDMIQQLIKDGYLLATMAQNPDVMGYEGIKTAVNALEGKDTGAENVDTGVSVITKETLGGAASAPAAAVKTDETFKVYLITMDQMDQHWVNVDAGAQKAGAELGCVDYKWLAPDVKDDAKQIECINNAVAGGAQAIMLAANGPDAVTAALQEAIDGGVKVIYVDSAASLPAVQTLATDNEAAGKTAGEEMIKALKENGIEEGKIGIVNVNAATASTVAREKGFRSAFEGTKFELLETQYGEGDAAKSKDIAANYITQGCVGIFGANEGSTVGTGNAIQEAGETVIGVGFDKSDMIQQLIKDGYLLATMAQNPDVMGYEGMKTSVNALLGADTGAANVDTGVSVITKETLK